MWAKVEEIIEDIRPILQSVGCDAKVVDVLDGVVTVELAGARAVAMSDPVRLREFVRGELEEEIPEVKEVKFVDAPPPPPPEPKVRVDVVVPPEDSDTAIFTADQVIGGENSALYASSQDAQADPLAARLFTIPNVDSVMIKDRMVILSRNGGTWPDLVDRVRREIVAHLSGERGAPVGDVDEEAIREKVTQLLESEVNPAVAAHGGFIELVEVQGPDIYLLMGGGCQGCGMAAVTLRQGVEQAIRQAVPEVRQILDATDHASGHQPYYPSM